MQVREAMSHDCKTVNIDDTLKVAAEHMRDDDIGMLLVEDGGGQLRGIITDRDITVRAVARGLGPDHKLQGCISEDLVSCHEDDSLEDAIALMEKEQVRRLLVRDANDKPVGVLAQADIARVMGPSGKLGEAVEAISRPGGKHTQH